MSQENSRQYKRDKASINPFEKPAQLHRNQRAAQGRPGSDWGLPQIEWLGIRYEWNCDIDQMLSSDSKFQPGSRLQHAIIDGMSMPWEDIANSKDHDQKSLYANLAHLAQIIKPLSEYDKSSTIEGLSSQPASQTRDAISPFSSPRQRQEPNTPKQNIPSSPPAMPASLTPRPKRQSPFMVQDHGPRQPYSSPLSSPPAITKTSTPYSQQQVSKSTSAFSPSPHGKGKSGVKRVVDGLHERHGDVESQGDPNSWSDAAILQLSSRVESEDALVKAAQGKGLPPPHLPLTSSSVTDRWSNLRGKKSSASYVAEDASSDVDYPDLKSCSSSEDLDYHPSSSQTALKMLSSELPNISKAQLQAEHKSEEDVKYAARVFLDELNNFFHHRCIAEHKESHRQWDLESITR